MGLALHLRASDGDMTMAFGWLVLGAIAVLSVSVASFWLVRRRQRREYKQRLVPMVAKNCERADACQAMADRVGVLEDQLAVERKYRAVLAAAVVMAYRAGGQEPPVDLMTTVPDGRRLHAVRDA